MNNQMMQMLMQLKGNPAAILSQFGIPQNIINSPRDILQHMLNKRQISQDQYDKAVKQAQGMGFKL